ncbi:MAG: hypothetical protein NC314_00605 [Roseburia sp.]|nr:hypothetical protein [Roseburia sp.]MCM1241313.1 hypothetical protein [Roseburia sp.]
MGNGISGLDSGLSNVYSSLLGGTSSTGGTGASTLLTDYASIKNGSYGKMMKAYYAKQKAAEEEESSDSVKSSSKKTQDAASASAARKFYETASKMNSLDYSADNIDKLYDSVSAFVKDYNSLMTSASKSKNSSVQAQADALNDYTYQNYKLFAKIGITMNSDRTLSIDEDTFKKVNERTGATNVPTISTLFQGVNSFADKAADRASKIYRLAGEGEAVTSSKAKYAGSTGSVSASDKTDSTSSTAGTSKTAKDSASATLASTLYKSVEKLNAMTISNDNKDEVYDAFSAFITDYNALIKKSSNSENSNVIKQTDYLTSLVSSNKSAFSRIGVTIGSDKTLSLDEDKFKEADMSNVKNLFTGSYSFAEKMTDRVNQIYRYATQGGSLTSQTYTSQGGYSAANTGSTLDTTL